MPALDFDAFRRSVLKREILPAYYLHGDVELLKEDGLRDLLAATLDPSTRDFNYDRRRAADMQTDEFATLAQTPPMMAARRALVITEVEALQQRRERMQKLRTAIVDYLAQPASETLLVLVQSAGEKVDGDFARRAASVAFMPLTPDKLAKWIRHRAGQEGLDLDDEAARHLYTAVGDDLPRLAAELAKLRSAVGDRPATADDVADLVGVRRGETAHDLSDAMTARDFGRAVPMVRLLLEAPGTSGVRLVMGLGMSLSGVAYARALLDTGSTPGSAEKELESAMFRLRPFGLRGYSDEARRWVRDARSWTLAELDGAMTEMLRADKRLKNTSLGGEIEIVTEALLAMAGAKVAA